MAMRIGGNYGTAMAYGFTAPKNKAAQEKTAEKPEVEQRSEDISELPEKQQPETVRTAGEGQNFGSVDELTRYLRDNFKVVSGGMTSISSKYLKKCLTDSDSREQLFDTLRAADEEYDRRKDEVGFQGMKVTIDEDGEVSSESGKATVTINEGKRRRQIAAAATRNDMQAVMAILEQDLQEVEDGLKQNMCDEAEVAKARRLIETARERMATLPDRAPTQAEQSAMIVNMLI